MYATSFTAFVYIYGLWHFILVYNATYYYRGVPYTTTTPFLRLRTLWANSESFAGLLRSRAFEGLCSVAPFLDTRATRGRDVYYRLSRTAYALRFVATALYGLTLRMHRRTTCRVPPTFLPHLSIAPWTRR